MTCEEFLEAYDLLLDVERQRGNLDPMRLVELQSHRTECATCRMEVTTSKWLAARLTKNLGQEADPPAPPEPPAAT